MPYDPQKHHRRSIRLRDYDYSHPGAYFVTVCAYQKTPHFGEIQDAVMLLNTSGQIAQNCWEELPGKLSMIALDAFIIMPDHVHGILIMRKDRRGQSPEWEDRTTLGAVIRLYKASVTHQVHVALGSNIGPIWQRNYYERVIRDAAELDNVRRYITENPLRRWLRDHPSD